MSSKHREKTENATPQHSREHFSDFLFYGLLLCFVYFVVRIFLPFLTPLGWAAVFAVIFYDVNSKLEKQWGRTPAAAATTAGVAFILIVPLLLIGALFVREGMQAAREMQTTALFGESGWYNHVWLWLTMFLARHGMAIDFPGMVREGANRFGQYLASELGGIVRNIVVFLFELFLMLFALFYFLRDGESIVDRCRAVLPFEDSNQERMLTNARDLIFASVTTSLVIAAVQGLICSVAFALVGLGSPVFWGVIMGFLSLLPIVGAWPVWIPAAIWLFSQGHYGRALILIGICGALGGTIDNILRPILLGGRSSLNALLVFISVLGGLAVFGALGIVLGPIVIATAVGVLDVYARRDSNAGIAATK